MKKFMKQLMTDAEALEALAKDGTIFGTFERQYVMPCNTEGEYKGRMIQCAGDLYMLGTSHLKCDLCSAVVSKSTLSECQTEVL